MVDQVRQAQKCWGALSFDERGLHLRRWRRQIWKSATQLADVIKRENGKPFEDAVVEVALTVAHISRKNSLGQAICAGGRKMPRCADETGVDLRRWHFPNEKR
ncbi:aldehyde dehydrogenase family protein [Prescottella agglutinans]|uniref:aldehyde dehydrogenase family protein n=1 Tax=Prescottella agglutinans TaxID=1644129 RepID=UPI003CC84E56